MKCQALYKGAYLDPGMLMRIAWLFSVLMTVSPCVAEAAPVLERVVMVSRHGVRSPIKTVDALNALTHRDWPTWPAGAGEMTEHGSKNLAFMADYLRDHYAKAGLLPASGCPADKAVEVWSDVADHRTRQSGDIFADRLAPGCKLVSRHADDGTVDPLFDATKTNACPIGLLASGEALATATKGRDLLTPEDRHALETLQGILAPDACGSITKGVCLVPDADATQARIIASLSVGSTIAEGLYLEYEQGFPAADVGWGKAGTPEVMGTIMPLHEHGIAILRRTPLLAARRGAVMAQAVLALLKGAPLPAGAPPLSSPAKVVMIAGHDSNLLYLAALMGLDWRLPDQPSVTAPDTTLAFEVWHDPATDKRTLKVVVYGQTLADLREATPLGASHPAIVVAVVPSACAGEGACELGVFVTDVDTRLAGLCKR